jgi:hypothetical protein
MRGEGHRAAQSVARRHAPLISLLFPEKTAGRIGLSRWNPRVSALRPGKCQRETAMIAAKNSEEQRTTANNNRTAIDKNNS